jgi:hypothetical protein
MRDLNINPKTGKIYADEIRKKVAEHRWAMLAEMAEFVAKEIA